MRSVLIVMMCIVAACVYGIFHDQITARVCVEYFTVGHDPTIFNTEDPTTLGFCWGIFATWWVGLALGLGLAIAARSGRRPPRTVRSLIRPVLGLMIIMAVLATFSGFAGYMLARNKAIQIAPQLAEKVPTEKHPRYLACFFAHTASYWTGFVGGGIQIAIVWASRKWIRPAPAKSPP